MNQDLPEYLILLPLKVLLNMVEFGMNPQQALDAPRVYAEYDRRSMPAHT